MIISIDETKLEEATKCGYNLNQIIEHVTDYEETQDKPTKEIKNQNTKVLICYENDIVVGVLTIVIMHKEKYIEACEGQFAEDKYQEIAMQFYEYLKDKYAGFQLDAVYDEQNKVAICFIEGIGAHCIGKDVFMKLNIPEFQYVDSTLEHENNVIKLKKEFYKEFCKIHDEHHKDVYWTGQRLLCSLDKFDILVAVTDNKVIASIVSTKYDDNKILIYFLETEPSYRRRGYAKSLLKAMIKQSIEANAKEITIEVDEDNIAARKLYETFGFCKICTKCTYTIKSI